MNQGYIKLYRKTVDNTIIRNPQLLQFWVWCLLKATHKEIEIHVGKQIVKLNPGQFIFGRKAAAAELFSTEMKIRGCLKSLQNSQNISSKSNHEIDQKVTTKITNKFTILTICNWELYQNDEEEDNQLNNQQTTNKQPTNNHKQEEKKKERTQNKFAPPLFEEVREYCQGRENGVNPQRFVDFYSSKGWMVGKSKMKDWRAAVRGWEKPKENNTPSPSGTCNLCVGLGRCPGKTVKSPACDKYEGGVSM